MGSGGGAAKSGDQTTSFRPWGGQQKYIKQIYQQAQEQYGQPQQYYPGQTTAPEDPASAESLAARYARATGGSEALRGANTEINKQLKGEYLGSNPWLDAMYQRSADAVTKNYNQTVLPRIDSRFAMGNRMGSGAYGSALGRSAGALADSLAGLATDTYGRNYETERGRMDAAARFAPQLAEADYGDINQLGQVGAQKEFRAQSAIDDLMARFNFAQNEPNERLARYASMIGAPIGGSSTNNKDPKTNWGNTILKTALDPLNFSGLFGG